MRFLVPPELDGRRADLVVARLGGMGRAEARRLVDAGSVLVDGSPAHRRQTLGAGTVVEFDLVPGDGALAPGPVPFGVLYEDEYLAVVDKPAGVATHPGAGRSVGTLASGILNRWPGVEGVGEEGRWGIVHRLDKDTSGLLLVALDQTALVRLRAAIKRRLVGREYLALVHGAPPTPTGTIDAPIGRDKGRPTRMRLDHRGRAARTHFRVLWSDGSFSLLQVRLDTGRTHQIRVHLASIGLPVAGDRVYGRAAGSPRTFLHARRLSFTHPVSGEQVEVESVLPPDLAGVLAELGCDYR